MKNIKKFPYISEIFIFSENGEKDLISLENTSVEFKKELETIYFPLMKHEAEIIKDFNENTIRLYIDPADMIGREFRKASRVSGYSIIPLALPNTNEGEAILYQYQAIDKCCIDIYVDDEDWEEAKNYLELT
jgi:hypothetical protein